MPENKGYRSEIRGFSSDFMNVRSKKLRALKNKPKVLIYAPWPYHGENVEIFVEPITFEHWTFNPWTVTSIYLPRIGVKGKSDNSIYSFLVGQRWFDNSQKYNSLDLTVDIYNICIKIEFEILARYVTFWKWRFSWGNLNLSAIRLPTEILWKTSSWTCILIDD